MKAIPILTLSALLALPAHSLPSAPAGDGADGRAIMEEVHARHRQFPYVYEEQSIIVIDRDGKRNTRRSRRYTREEEDGTLRFLLIFDTPADVRGVALLATRLPDGDLEQAVYLPAFGRQMIGSTNLGTEGNLLGTDFSVESLTGEELSDYRYVRRDDAEIDQVRHFRIDVYSGEAVSESAPALRRHFIRQDNFFIIRTDHYDRQGRLFKRQTFHDLKPLDGNMWGAGMVLMEDRRSGHQTLIKIDRRVFSRDYVPEEMFSAEWLFAKYTAPDDGEIAAAEETEGEQQP
jgi:hypothetical protein